ncbi:hypothetical protein [Yoonia sp.]|uniref:hypothetical protein n=1 Tax=Yoonia sp. TaxID=2212373 RepID=UPI003A4D2BA0
MKTTIQLADRTQTGVGLVWLYVGSVVFGLFYQLPLIYWADISAHTAAGLWIAAGVEALRAIIFLGPVYFWRNPVAAIHFMDLSLGPRVFFVGALVSMSAVGLSVWALLPVILIWGFLEFVANRDGGAIAGPVLHRRMIREGVLSQTDQDWIFRFAGHFPDLLHKAPGATLRKRLVRYVGLPFALIAPAIWMLSLTNRDQFDLRLLLIAMVSLVLGVLTSDLLAHHRANRLVLAAIRTGNAPRR